MISPALSLLLLSLSLFPLLTISATSPNGTWSYIEGNSAYGPLYLCLGSDDSALLTGGYSEYGYVRGSFSSKTRTVTGKWFEVGSVYANGMPTSGFFSWKFDSTYQSFTGSYYYDGQDPSTAKPWNSNRIDTVTPTNLQCFRHTTTSSSLNGRWTWPSAVLYFAQNGLGTDASNYNSSVVNEDSPGYSEGSCDTMYQVCHGQIVRTDYYGQIMYVLGASKSLYVTAFEGSWDDDYFDIPSQLNGNHLYVTASLNTTSVTQADAAQNQVILFQGSFTETPVQTTFSYFSFVTGVGSGVNVEGYAFESSVVRGNYNWSTRTLSGMWFDPGLLYPGNTYTTGTFDLTVSSDWGVVSGTFDNYHVGETVPYSSGQWGPFYRASFVLPPPSAALVDLSQPDTPISGYYVGDWSLYLCESEGLFNASFFITQSGFSGYATGRCGPQYKVCNGDFIANSQRGQLLITVLSDTQIQIDYYFATFLQLPEPSLRNSVTLTSGNHDYSPVQCATNLYLPFVGNFTDPEYGLFLYISYDPFSRLLNGFYSELGVLRGSINAETGLWEARWVEPGILYFNTTVPTSGYAFFRLLSLDSFTGNFFFDNSLQVPSHWGVVTRNTYLTPSNALAWVSTAYHDSLDGIFFSANNDQIWFCEHIGVSDENLNHPFYMSFVWNMSDVLISGYAEGGCSFQTRVCHGEWYASDATSGVLITSLADPNNLRLSTFVGEMSPNTVDQVGTSTHQLTAYTRLKMSATDEQCHQYGSGHSLVVGVISIVGVAFVSLFW